MPARLEWSDIPVIHNPTITVPVMYIKIRNLRSCIKRKYDAMIAILVDAMAQA